MVGSGMEFKSERIEVGCNVYRSVQYKWHRNGEKTTILMRYEGDEIDPILISPPQIISNDEHALTIVRLYAMSLYDEEKASGD